MITIPGKVPSKKNSRINMVRKVNVPPYWKIISIPSNEYRTWHKEASKRVAESRHTQLLSAKGVTIRFWLFDRRRRDLTNMAESLMDLLVDNHILPDDCWEMTGPITLIPCGVDKVNPRAEIELLGGVA